MKGGPAAGPPVCVRGRQTFLVLPHLLRSVRSGPLLAGAVASWLIVAHAGLGDSEPRLVKALRLAALAMCAGAAYLLDDPTEGTLGASPSPLSFRRGLKLLIGGLAIAGPWGSLLVLSDHMWPAGSPHELPSAGLSLELVALGLAGLALASLLIRPPNVPSAGPVASGLLAALWITAFWHPKLQQWMFGGVPGDSAWADARLRWTAVAALAAGAILARARDPARRPHATCTKVRRSMTP